MRRLLLSLILISLTVTATGIDLIPQARAQLATFESNPLIIGPFPAGIPGLQAQLAAISGISLENSGANTLTLTETLLKWAKELYNEVLRRQLLNFLVQQIINYINGTGDGKFVADWNTFLNGAAGEAVEYFSKLYLGINLCSPFDIQLKLSLVNVPSFENKYSCTLDQVIANIESFRNNFRDGSWLAYSSAFEANNNFYGAYLKVTFERAKVADDAKNASRLEAMAGNGFLDAKDCQEIPIPSGSINGYTPFSSGGPNTPAGLSGGYSDLQGNSVGRDIDGDGKANDDPSTCKTVTPGATIGNLAAKALGSDIEYVIEAKELAAYVTAIANAVFNRVLKEGLAAIQPDPSGIESYVDVSRVGRNDQQQFSSQQKELLSRITESINARQNAQTTIERTGSTLSIASVETAKAALIYLQAEFASVENEGDLQRQTNNDCAESFDKVRKIQNVVIPRIEERIFEIENVIKTIELATDDDTDINPDSTPEDNADIIAYLEARKAELEAITEDNDVNREVLVSIQTELGGRFVQEAKQFRIDILNMRKTLADTYEFIERHNERLNLCTTHPPTTPIGSNTVPSKPFPWED